MFNNEEDGIGAGFDTPNNSISQAIEMLETCDRLKKIAQEYIDGEDHNIDVFMKNARHAQISLNIDIEYIIKWREEEKYERGYKTFDELKMKRVEGMDNHELETILRKHLYRGDRRVYKKDLYLPRKEIIEIVYDLV